MSGRMGPATMPIWSRYKTYKGAVSSDVIAAARTIYDASHIHTPHGVLALAVDSFDVGVMQTRERRSLIDSLV